MNSRSFSAPLLHDLWDFLHVLHVPQPDSPVLGGRSHQLPVSTQRHICHPITVALQDESLRDGRQIPDGDGPVVGGRHQQVRVSGREAAGTHAAFVASLQRSPTVRAKPPRLQVPQLQRFIPRCRAQEAPAAGEAAGRDDVAVVTAAVWDQRTFSDGFTVTASKCPQRLTALHILHRSEVKQEELQPFYLY